MSFPQERPAAASPAALPLRIAAMVYDGVLLFGVVFITGYLLLQITGWTHPLSTAQRSMMQLVLFVAIGAYFVSCWSLGGQTLAMKTWHLRLVDARGKPPDAARSLVRYLAAWHLWIPGIVAVSLVDSGVGARLALLLGGFALMLLPAWFDADSRLLHDRCSGTRIVRSDRSK